MKYILIQTLFLITFSLYSFAQTRNIEAESSVTTNHFVTVKGMKIPYSATAGTLPVWSDEDKAVATLFYTYYKRTDLKNNENRPLFISFNGNSKLKVLFLNL